MNLLFRFFSILLFLLVVGTLLVSVARKLVQTKPTPDPIKVLNANESYKFEEKNERKAR